MTDDPRERGLRFEPAVSRARTDAPATLQFGQAGGVRMKAKVGLAFARFCARCQRVDGPELPAV